MKLKGYKVFLKLPEVDEWHDKDFITKMNFLSWRNSIQKLHTPNTEKDLNSNYLTRLAYDEIFANLLFNSHNRNKIKKVKKNNKFFEKKNKIKI